MSTKNKTLEWSIGYFLSKDNDICPPFPILINFSITFSKLQLNVFYVYYSSKKKPKIISDTFFQKRKYENITVFLELRNQILISISIWK